MGNIFHDNNGKLDEVSAYHPYDHSDDGSEYTSFFPSLGCDDRNQMGSTVKTRCSTAETDLDFPPTLGSVISHMPRKSTIEMQLKSLFFFPMVLLQITSPFLWKNKCHVLPEAKSAHFPSGLHPWFRSAGATLFVLRRLFKSRTPSLNHRRST